MTGFRKVVIPAAGLGTRLLPVTKSVPKEMLPVVDRPMLQYAVDEAIESGCDEIILVTGPGKEAISDYYPADATLEERIRFPSKESLPHMPSRAARISHVFQQDPMGLGHAICQARGSVGEETFAVVLCDDIILHKVSCLRQLKTVQEAHGGCILAVMEVPRNQIPCYGIVAAEPLEDAEQGQLYRVLDLVEKPSVQDAPSDLAIVGRYLLTPSIFEILDQTEPSAGGEVQLTDGLRELLREEPIYAYRFQGDRYDAGDKLGFLMANLAVGLQRKELSSSLRQHLASLKISLR